MQAMDVDFFFAPPVEDWYRHQRPDGTVSVLYLVRREIQDCLIGKCAPLPENEVVPAREPHRLFATAMVIFAGIDLLAKFVDGSDTGPVTTRFTCFCRVYMNMSADEASTLWRLRNGFMHSFGLHDRNKKRSLAYALRDHSGQGRVIVSDRDNETWIVCVEELYVAFTQAISRYQNDLASDATLEQRFDKIFPAYGKILVRIDPPISHRS